MTERRDDTTNEGAESRPERAPRGGYYYDDSTGYEPYTPERDDEEDEDDEERMRDEG